MLGGSARQRCGGVAATLLICVLVALAPATASGKKPSFINKLDPPSTPTPERWGSELRLDPAPLLGNLEGDAEFWDLFYTAAAGIASQPVTAPRDGWLTGVYVKGYLDRADRFR